MASLPSMSALTGGGASVQPVVPDAHTKLTAHEVWEEPDEKELRAGIAPHRCTDVTCVLVLLLALVGLSGVLQHARLHGDWRRLHHGFDFLGNLCGVDSYSDKPFLYYCPANPLKLLDLAHPICVTACPTTAMSWHSCYTGHSTSIKITDPMTNSFDETFHYTFTQVADYPSTVFAARYCMPKDNFLYQQLVQAIMDSSIATWLMTTSVELMKAWPALLASFFIAVGCGYAYLLLLKQFTGAFVYATLIVPCVIFSCTGAYMVVGALGSTAGLLSQVPGLNIGQLRGFTTGNNEWDLWLGIGFIAVGVLFGIVCCCCKKSIDMAIGVVEASSECMQQMPGLLMSPVLAATSQLFTMSLLFAGFLWLISCGKVQEESMAHYVTTPGMLGDIRGIARSFEYKEEEYYYLAFYVFMIVWIFELCTAVSQFTLVYAVELWYFVPYEDGKKRHLPLAPLAKGLRIGLQYHLGSLALGAFLVACMRVLRMVGAAVTKRQKDAGNDVGAVAAACCTAVITCFERFILYLNKNAYMDVAMHSSNYCTAALTAFKTLNATAVAVGVLNGVTWVLQFAGVGTVSAAGAALTYLMLVNVPTFNDPAKANFVPNPVPVCVVAGIICAATAFVFMMVFDTVSDTILYCFIIEHETKGSSSARYTPEPLSRLIDRHTPDT